MKKNWKKSSSYWIKLKRTDLGKTTLVFRILLFMLAGFMLASITPIYAQEIISADTTHIVLSDSIKTKSTSIPHQKWMPDPNRALWLALVIPGGGQIYNRKYWKLPIVYGGFVGCAYALSWNNMMFKDYSQAYLDIMDNDENTKSYENFLPYGTKITEANKNRYQTILKKKKDYFRKYRDMSVFAFGAVYLLSVIDAYVDANLSSFEINDDLSLRIEPAVLTNLPEKHCYLNKAASAYGLQCSIKF